MSKESQILKQARQEVLAGQDKKAVFEKYQGQIAKPLRLATFVAATPSPPIPPLARALNMVLFILLLLAAVTKIFGMIAVLGAGVPLVAMFGAVVLGLIIPVVFAIAVYKWEGQVYGILALLCGLNILRSWMNSEGQYLGAAIETVFFLVLIVLTLTVRKLAFPNLGFLGVKKDGQGGYIF